MREPIYNINGDFDHLLDDEKYNDPTEQDYDDFDDYTWNTEREINCFSCNGIGEGSGETRCSFCGGKGYIIKKN